MHSRFAVVLGLALVLAASSAQAEVRVTMKGGLVTLSASNATTREILAEWARVGQTQIVNAERIAGAPLSMELTDVPEAQALDIVLRSVSGYMAAPRAEVNLSLSRYDRILVLPTSAPPRNSPAPTPAPAFQPPPFPLQTDDGPDDRSGPPGFLSPGNPVFNTFPQPGPSPNDPPPQPALPAPVFGAPGGRPLGVSVPGMVVPAPTQPGQFPPGGQFPAGQFPPGGQFPPTRPPDQDQR